MFFPLNGDGQGNGVTMSTITKMIDTIYLTKNYIAFLLQGDGSGSTPITPVLSPVLFLFYKIIKRF